MDKIASESELRGLILEVLSRTSADDWDTIKNEVISRFGETDFGSLGRQGEQRINQVIIGLIVEQLVTVGTRSGSYTPKWPSIMLTELGRNWTAGSTMMRDPNGYAALLKESAPGVEETSVEYALEAFRCLQQNLLFACAVMIGAAAERELFRLGKAILAAGPEESQTKRLKDAIDRGKLPTLLQEIRSALEKAIKCEAMPYIIHQGATEHLISFHEMIRVQRNDAVHMGAIRISKDKAFLALQTFPVALGTIDRIRLWFERTHAS